MPDVFTGGMFVSTSYGLGTEDVPVPPAGTIQAHAEPRALRVPGGHRG